MDRAYPIPPDEAGRLAALRRYRLLDSDREPALDRIANLAASLLGTDRGIVSLVDSDRVWIKSGSRGQRIPRELSICSRTIMGREVMVVPDTSADPRYRDNPLVKQYKVRFYAGAPLVTADGYSIGSLNVVDSKPHAPLAEAEKDRLKALAQMVMNELDLRRELVARIEMERDLELANRLLLAIAEADNATSALETSLRLIAVAADAIHGSVFKAVPQSDAVEIIAAYGSNEFWRKEVERVRAIKFTLGRSLTGLTLERNEPVICNVAEAAREFPQLSYKLAANAKFSISVPLAQSGARFVLHLFFSEDPPNAEQLAARIGELAAKIRPALVRKLSEERIALLQSVVLHANDAAMVLMPESNADPDAALHIVYVNPAMERLTLYPAAELIGKRPSLLWGAGPTAPLEGVGPLRQELQCRRQDGSEFWADVSTSPANDGGGERRVIAMLRDMTMRRSLEEALREREHTFRLMFSRAPVPTMLIDVKSGRYVEVNDAAVELFGYTREQFLTMTAEEIRAPEEVDRYRAMRKTPVPASGRRGLWRYLKADGSTVLVDVSVHPFRSQGRAMAIIVTVDVTEQKRIEEQFRLARDSAEAMSRAKSDLLANMSHELRTPLNAIIGFSEIMREELFGPLGSARYGGYVGDVLESAQHLLAVINDILDLAKIEANSFRLREAPVDPDAVVASAIRLVRARADEAGIAVRFDNQAPSVAISADETALKRVLVNLLANAVKFSESGTLVTVRASVTNEGGLALAVEDLGIGMAAEDIPVALMPFQQVQNGMRRKYEGTGLGLPIAKQLVELHGGQLTIESQRGIGTTVTMTLPPWRILGEAPWPHLAALAG